MTILRAFAVLFALLAVSNLLKPLGLDEKTGFVFMGRRLEGTPNLIAGWSFALYLAWYAASLWKEKASALPIGIAYGAYVAANLFLFMLRMPAPTGGQRIFGIVYTVVALGGAWGAVWAMVRAGYAGRDAAPGRILLRSFALLFALMALSNLLKPFAYTDTVGFVLLGQRLEGTANAIAALVFSGLLAVYAWSIWTENRRALALGIAYAAYVVVNLVLWNFRKPEGSDAPLLFAIPYLISAIGVSGGAAALLWKHRARFEG
jgi:hypothetical protein